jgi:hypothetical protein
VHHLVKAVLAAAAIAAGATPAVSLANGVHTHDGFFLRLEPGFGYQKASASEGGNDASFSGAAGHLSVSIGGAPKENLIIAGNLFSTAAVDPKAEVNGVERDTEDLTVGLAGIGPQLTWYFMPANVYVSGTLAMTRLTVDNDGEEGETEAGIGGRLAIGKEWWVSNQWGLGVAGYGLFSSNEDKDGGPRWRTWSAGVTFSATYN